MRNPKWQQCYLHSNWKFGHPSARTSRQAFGHDVEFEGRHKVDGSVFMFGVAAAIIVAILEWLK